MAVELFGIEVAQYAALTSIITFLITGHRSVFSSQILLLKKADNLDIELGHSIDKTEVNYTRGAKFRKLRDRLRRKSRTKKSD